MPSQTRQIRILVFTIVALVAIFFLCRTIRAEEQQKSRTAPKTRTIDAELVYLKGVGGPNPVIIVPLTTMPVDARFEFFLPTRGESAILTKTDLISALNGWLERQNH